MNAPVTTMTMISVRLSDDIVEKVKEKAAASGVTAADSYRELIEKGLTASSPNPNALDSASPTAMAGLSTLIENQAIVTLKELFILKHTLRAFLNTHPRGADIWKGAETAAVEEMDSFFS